MDAEKEESQCLEGQNQFVFRTCCAFCDVKLTETMEPQLLPCLHSACKSCAFSDSGTNLSPAGVCNRCKQKFDEENVIDDVLLTEQLGYDKGPYCTSCDTNSSAPGYCATCEEWLCKECIIAHYRVKVTKDHNIRTVDDVPSDIVRKSASKKHSMLCPKHPQEQLEFFCTTCDVLTCRDCQLEDHKAHLYETVSTEAQKLRTFLSKSLSLLFCQLAEAKTKRDVTELAIKQLKTSQENMEKKLVKNFTLLANEVEQRKQQLTREVYFNSVCNSYFDLLNKFKSYRQVLAARFEVCYRILMYAVLKAQKISFIYCKNLLDQQLKNLDKVGDVSGDFESRLQSVIIKANLLSAGQNLLCLLRKLSAQCVITSNSVTSQEDEKSGTMLQNESQIPSFIVPNTNNVPSSSMYPVVGPNQVHPTISCGLSIRASSYTTGVLNTVSYTNHMPVASQNSQVTHSAISASVPNSVIRTAQAVSFPNASANHDSQLLSGWNQAVQGAYQLNNFISSRGVQQVISGRNYRMPITNLSQPIQNPVMQSHSYITCSQFPASNHLLNLSGSVYSTPFNDASVPPSSSVPSIHYNNAPQFIVQNSSNLSNSSTSNEILNQPNRTIQSSCNTPTSSLSCHQHFQQSSVRQLSQFADNVAILSQNEFNYRQGNSSLHNQGLTNQTDECITFNQGNQVQSLNNYNSQRPDQGNSVLQSSNHAADIPNSDLTVSSTNSPSLTATEVTVSTDAESSITSVHTVANGTAYSPLTHSNEDRTAPVVDKQNAVSVGTIIVTPEDNALTLSNSDVDLLRPGEATESVPEKVATENASENGATCTVKNSKEVRQASEKRISDSGNVGSSDQSLQEDITVSSSETHPLEENVETVLQATVTHLPSERSPQRSPDTSTQIFPFENASVAKRKLRSPSKSNHEVVPDESQRTSDDVPTSSGLGDDSLQIDPVTPPSDDEVVIFGDVVNVETDDSVKEGKETVKPQNESHENVLDNGATTNLPADKESTENSENTVQNVEKDCLAGRRLDSPVIIDCDEISCVICTKSIGELVCCSICSRLYHEQCYVHPLPAPGFEESWKCLMCMEVNHCPLPPRYGRKRKCIYLAGRDVLKCQRLLLELYMCSASIFNGESKRIVDLSAIKKRITDSFFIPYEEPAEFIEDIKILLETSQRNCKIGSRESVAVQKLRAGLNDLISRYFPSLLAGISSFHTAENTFSPSRKKQKVMC